MAFAPDRHRSGQLNRPFKERNKLIRLADIAKFHTVNSVTSRLLLHFLSLFELLHPDVDAMAKLVAIEWVQEQIMYLSCLADLAILAQ